MKRTLSITLAVLSVGLLGSCSKINERLDNLEKEVSGIENEQIASINSQIDGIKTSISDLGQIRSDISSLKQSASDHSVDIFNLEEADRALKDRIVNLEDYVDAVLPNYAEKEWVEATFSTLEQYEATCDTIAKIDARIGALDAKLSKDIKATADSLTKWVNKQFEGYYTAAEMDASLAQMKSDIDSARAAGKISDAKADSIATELTNAKAAVDTAKANIRKEYRAAIDTAIKASEGKLTKELTDKITTVNTAITNLTTRVTNLEAKVDELTGRVDKLEGMIQSVVIVPAYSDGSVKVEDDTLFIDCVITPAEAVEVLDTADFTILLNRVKTKAVALDTVPTDSIKVFTKEMKSGTVSIQAYIPTFLAELRDESLTVAVNVKNGGLSDITTKFVNVDNTSGYTVTFNNNYGTSPVTRDTSVLKGGKINKPSDPVREGYFFDKWFTKNAAGATYDWDFETMTVSQDTTLYAEWIKGAKVTFRKDIANLTVCKDTVVHPNTKVNKPAVDPDSTGYAFTGWFTRKADGTFGDKWNFDNTNVTKDTTLYAKWAKTSMTIAELVATNSKFPFSNSDDVIPGNVWLTANNDSCYFVTGYHITFTNRTRASLPVTFQQTFELTRQGDGSYQNEQGTLKFVMDCDSVVSITLNRTGFSEALNGDYKPSAPEGFVDLGVVVNSKPVYWAKKNLGASKPEEYSKYYSWGDVTGQTPSGSTFSKSFIWDNDVFGQTFQKVAQNIACPNGILASTYDAATVANSSWRTPTSEEFKALAASCVWIWCDGENKKYNNTTVKGYIVYKAKSDADKGKANINGTWKKWDVSKSEYVTDGASEATGYTTSDTHIFFPAAGNGNNTDLSGANSEGYYWSSSFYTDITENAYSLNFGSSFVKPLSGSNRKRGFSVRPVSD